MNSPHYGLRFAVASGLIAAARDADGPRVSCPSPH